jgi:hypothetical protein
MGLDLKSAFVIYEKQLCMGYAQATSEPNILRMDIERLEISQGEKCKDSRQIVNVLYACTLKQAYFESSGKELERAAR